MNRRTLLLGAGGAALLAACGADTPAARPVDVLGDQLRVTRLAIASYAGVDAPALVADAQARARRIETALRAAGGAPGPAPKGPSGANAAYAAEGRALAAHVAGIGELRDPASRTLLAGLVVDAARAQAALAPLAHRDPFASAFPGQPR